MAGKVEARSGQPGAGRQSPKLAAPLAAAAATALLLAVLGGLALAFLLTDARAREALAGLTDHPWWLVYRGPAGGDAAAWAVGAATAAALVAAAALSAARRMLERSPALPSLAAGIFLFTMAFECLRGAAAFLVATDRSTAAALFLSRAVCFSRFTGLLSLLLVALHALELPEQRPGVLVPVVLVASLAMAASVPVDRTTFLAQLTFRLGDEQGVWFVNLVIGALIPLSVVAAAIVRREARLVLLAAIVRAAAGRPGARLLRPAPGAACLRPRLPRPRLGAAPRRDPPRLFPGARCEGQARGNGEQRPVAVRRPAQLGEADPSCPQADDSAELPVQVEEQRRPFRERHDGIPSAAVPSGEPARLRAPIAFGVEVQDREAPRPARERPCLPRPAAPVVEQRTGGRRGREIVGQTGREQGVRLEGKQGEGTAARMAPAARAG